MIRFARVLVLTIAAMGVMCLVASSALAINPIRCSKPGELLVTDLTNDQSPAGTTNHDIQELYITEPFTFEGENNITFLIDLQTFDPAAPQLSSTYYVLFNTPNGTRWWVSVETCDATQIPTYSFGVLDPMLGFQGMGDASGELLDGAVCVGISSAALENAIPGGGFGPGTVLAAIQADVRLFAGAQCNGIVSQMDASPTVATTLCGSDTCRPVPNLEASWAELKDLYR